MSLGIGLGLCEERAIEIPPKGDLCLKKGAASSLHPVYPCIVGTTRTRSSLNRVLSPEFLAPILRLHRKPVLSVKMRAVLGIRGAGAAGGLWLTAILSVVSGFPSLRSEATLSIVIRVLRLRVATW